MGRDSSFRKGNIAKLPEFSGPTLHRNLEANSSPGDLATDVAAWSISRLCEDEKGLEISISEKYPALM